MASAEPSRSRVRPSAGRHDAGRGALDGDGGVHRRPVDLRGDRLDLGGERGVLAGDDGIDLAVAEQGHQPGPGVERLVVGLVDRGVDVQRDPGGRGGQGRLDAVGDDRVVGDHARGQVALELVALPRRGRGCRCRRRLRRSSGGCRPRRSAGRRRTRRPGRRPRRPARGGRAAATTDRVRSAEARRREAGRRGCRCPSAPSPSDGRSPRSTPVGGRPSRWPARAERTGRRPGCCRRRRSPEAASVRRRAGAPRVRGHGRRPGRRAASRG